jgi:transketolase
MNLCALRPTVVSMNFAPKTLRQNVLRMAHRGGSVHIACAFSLIEVMSFLYSEVLNFNPTDPKDPERDYLVLSKGHGVMAQYACFRQIGWLTDDHLNNYFKDGSLLHGLSEAHVPGCEVSSGTLGHGLPIAAGLALGLKLRGDSKKKIFCIVGDGELNEGPCWEALAFASHHKLDNLWVIVDANGFQAMGRSVDVLNMEPMAEKFASFGFAAADCDGHDIACLKENLSRLSTESKPKAIVARTVKGHGISFMEGDNRWHYTRISDELLEQALQELSK